MPKRNTETKAAVENYRRLVTLQAKLPSARQWELGAAIRVAKMRAYVELEAGSR